MKARKHVRLVNPDTGEGCWYEMATINHLLKLQARKQFVVDCAFCHNNRVDPCETHIQHGLFEDKYWEYVWCQQCEKITLHIYTVAQEI